MDGFELLARLKADEIVIPSIMITGHGDISMAVKAMQAEVRDFLEKPFSHQDLVASIRRVLDESPEVRPIVRTAARGCRTPQRLDSAPTANP